MDLTFGLRPCLLLSQNFLGSLISILAILSVISSPRIDLKF